MFFLNRLYMSKSSQRIWETFRLRIKQLYSKIWLTWFMIEESTHWFIGPTVTIFFFAWTFRISALLICPQKYFWVFFLSVVPSAVIHHYSQTSVFFTSSSKSWCDASPTVSLHSGVSPDVHEWRRVQLQEALPVPSWLHRPPLPVPAAAHAAGAGGTRQHAACLSRGAEARHTERSGGEAERHGPHPDDPLHLHRAGTPLPGRYLPVPHTQMQGSATSVTLSATLYALGHVKGKQFATLFWNHMLPVCFKLYMIIRRTHVFIPPCWNLHCYRNVKWNKIE